MAASASATWRCGVRESADSSTSAFIRRRSYCRCCFSQKEPKPSRKSKSYAVVVALSPKSLTAKNRFICELCDKGFPREQNLQLHRRGHNLPWKLKKKTDQEVQKKVYICPEISCAHHDPARALRDLSGIKKYFARKHGEKKFSCTRCHKRYVVLSDLKAHSKMEPR